MKTTIKVVVVLVLLAGLATGGVLAYKKYTGPSGDLLATISATGTVEPEEVVDVGAQVAGEIKKFGVDKDGKTVDYGSTVEQGTILAEIDKSLYAADVASTQAQLDQAKAAVVRAKADLEQMKAKLNQAERDWQRAQKLGPSEALAKTTYDAYKSGFEVAQANVAVGDAAIVQAQATVAQAEAAMQRSQRNLSYCTISSPVNGVIIDRRVNIGQTVVSSLNAPSLFLIAKDLKRMEVWVPVNEADIGNIHEGQPVTFTVDAYPGEAFKGVVGKIRYNATMTQNVVTYTVEVITDNSSGKLLPYLTAKVQFELSRHENILKVANAALRWSPTSATMVVPEARDALGGSGGGRRSGGGRPGAGGGSAPTAAKTGEPAEAPNSPKGKTARGILWLAEGEFVRPLKVRVGPSDGTMTEIQGEDLKDGLEVVVDVERPGSAAPQAAVNPFMPQMPSRRSPTTASSASSSSSSSR